MFRTPPFEFHGCSVVWYFKAAARSLWVYSLLLYSADNKYIYHAYAF